jgi:hypothetical protein
MRVARLQWGLDSAKSFEPPFDIVLMSDVVYADYADRSVCDASFCPFIVLIIVDISI